MVDINGINSALAAGASAGANLKNEAKTKNEKQSTEDKINDYFNPKREIKLKNYGGKEKTFTVNEMADGKKGFSIEDYKAAGITFDMGVDESDDSEYLIMLANDNASQHDLYTNFAFNPPKYDRNKSRKEQINDFINKKD